MNIISVAMDAPQDVINAPFGKNGGKSDISQMSEEEMKKLICLYDFLYPDTAKKIDDILASGKNNTLTDADKNKIKYIAYTAPEPYRSVYLGYVDSYEVGRFGGKDCSEISMLSDDEIKIRNAVVARYDAELAGEEAEAANDIYGGVTNLEIGEKYGYGHRSVNDAGEYNYWYDSEGNETGAQGKELFAEYFSYYMTGDKLAIASMREHFPQACQVLDEMLNSMKETIVEEKSEK